MMGTFDKEKFSNWVKSSLSLRYAKDGIAEFANEKADRLKDDIEKSVAAKCKSAISKTCSSCTPKSVHNKKGPGNQYYMRCKSNVCDHWISMIQNHAKPGHHLEWTNSDPKQWPRQSWEIAKVFMGFGCGASRNANDIDCANLMTMMIGCTFYHRFISNMNILQEIKDIRNAIMHSSSLEVSGSDMKDYLNKLIELLEDPNFFKNDNTCQEAADKIKQLRDNTLAITLSDEKEELSSLINELQKEIGNLKKMNDAYMQDVQNLPDDLSTFSEAHNELKTELQTNMKTIEMKQSQCDYLIESLEKKVDQSEIKGRIQSIANQLDSLNEDTQHNLQRLQDKFEAINQRQTKTEQRVDLIESKQTMSETALVELRSRQDTSEQTIIGVEAKQNIAEQKLDDITSEVSSIRRDIHILDGSTFEERKKNLQRQLCGAYSKHCGSMSIYPLRPNLARPCGYLYVSQEMLEKDPRGPKKPLPDNTDKFEPSHQQKDKKVNRLNEVFYTDNKLCKNIYITGEAGVGKSTFCDYIINMWLAAHTVTTVNYTEYSSQDLETMKQFPLLFYIQLKGETLDSDTDIYANLIEKQWDLDTGVKEFLTEEHCVIIADALDECTSGIPKRGVRNNSTVLTTSRPWKLETLRTDIEGSKIDKHIEIVCLDEKSVETLTEKILPVLAEESGTMVKNSDNFIKEMKEKCLESFLRIPVLLIQILCLWHDNVTIGKSKTSIYCNLVHHQIQVYIKKLSAKDEKKLLPNSETLSPVNCKVSKCQCRAFNEMLLKVGKMALNTLLSDKLEYELVFDHNITEFHEFCEQEIETCLAIGILSQHKLFGKITKLEKFISFVHKSNQEFFGSIYLACKIPISKIREVLANYICSLDKMLKLEKIIMFVSGLNREMGREMANLLLEAAGRDPRIQEHRQTVDWHHRELVSNVQNVILAAVEESRHNPHELQQKFRLDDIYVDVKNVSRVLSCFPVMEISRPASITMKGESFNNRVQVDAVMSHVQNTVGLQRVYLWNCTIGSRETAVKLVPQSLCVLYLDYVNLSHEALTTLSHNLKTTKLRVLGLSFLICGSHGWLRNGKCVTFDLTRQSHLEMLQIAVCDMSGWSLPTATPQLEHVYLGNVTIPGAMLARFLRGLPQTRVRVYLLNVTVRPAGDFVSCLEQLRGSRVVERDSVEGRGWGGSIWRWFKRREGELFVNEFEFI